MSSPIRLQREDAAAGQAGCSMAIGIFLTILGSGIYFFARRSGEPDQFVVYAVGAGFGLVGLLLTVLGIKMWLAMRTPETIVEASRMPVRGGERFQLTVRQPGPVRLKSLRVNVTAEQISTRWVWRNGTRKTDTDRRLIHVHNVLDEKELNILAGEDIARVADVTVPARLKLADVEGEKKVVWRLEVWGKVRGWTDFGHWFAIDVSGVELEH